MRPEQILSAANDDDDIATIPMLWFDDGWEDSSHVAIEVADSSGSDPLLCLRIVPAGGLLQAEHRQMLYGGFSLNIEKVQELHAALGEWLERHE